MELKVKKLVKDAKLPTKAYDDDAGLDLYCTESVILQVYNPNDNMEVGFIPPEDMYLVKTGISVEIPKGHYGEIACKSSLGKLGIRLHPGIIDASYRGEVMIWMQNLGQKSYTVNKGDKVAQLLIKPVVNIPVVEVQKVSETERGTKGHGLSGK